MRRVGLLVTIIALGGCATSEVARIAESYHEHVYELWTLSPGSILFGVPAAPSGSGHTLLTRECPRYPIMEGNALIGHRDEVCVEVAGTQDASDFEFWKFPLYEIAQQLTPFGIPIGPAYKSSGTRKIGVVGAKDACEHLRRHFVKPKGVLGNDGESWTEPCEGPFYFRRVPSNIGTR